VPKKIIFYGVSSHLGGAERSLLDFLLFYKKSPNPMDFFVLLPKDQGPLVDKLKENSINYKTIPFPDLWTKLSRQSGASQLMFLLFGIPSYLFYLIRLYLFLKKEAPTAIHSTGIKCHMSLCLLNSFLPAQIIIHFRDLLGAPSIQKFFLKFKDRPNITWIAASKAIAKTFPKLPMGIVYCGFSETQYAPNKNKYLHDLLKIPHSDRLVGLVGVFARWKGQKEYILAAHRALAHLPNCHFLLIGGQIYDTSGERGFTENLHKLVDVLDRTDRIHFVPFQKHPEIVYNSLDLLVHCSIEPEPFGRVIVEGLFCEVPVVASGAGGALEIIRDESYGLLHPPGDYQDLAQKMIQSLKDNDRNTKAQIAAQKTRQDYNFEGRFRILKEIVEKY
jgi:glycosyltransferase involved in cell wall biosynthesis